MDLIVSGTKAHTGMPGLIIGNACETILSPIDCSALAVKPDGFAAPIKLEEQESMTTFYLGLALFLLLTLVTGMWRILRGPSEADRMLAAQLFGTTSVAILLLLAEAMGHPALRNVGLVFALLGAVAVVAFVRRAWPMAEEKHFDDA